MASPQDDIATLLEGAGVGAKGPGTGWRIFIGGLPASPDSVIVVERSGGLPPNPKYALDFPQIQVIVRGAAGETQSVDAKAEEVKRALLGISPQTGAFGKVWGITLLSDIAPLGRDEHDRKMVSLNFQLWVEPNQVGNRQEIF